MDLRDQLDAAFFCMSVHFLQICRCIAAALIIEIRFLFDFICICQPEIQSVVPHCRKYIQVALDRFDGRNDAAGTFDQRRQMFKPFHSL